VRRRPFREKRLVEAEEGEPVAVTGIVVDYNPSLGEGKIDDGSSVVTFALESLLFAEEIDVGRFVRLLGRIYYMREGRLLRVEIAQRLNVSPSLYRKVREVEGG